MQINRHNGETCYIIGKGPSLDSLTESDFGPGPIIAINETIVKIESLNLSNPIYSLQQDGKEQCMRCPKRATLLLSERSKQWFPDYTPRYVYDRVRDFGPVHIFTAITAISFAKQWNCKEIVFMCFDACTCSDASYAKTGINYRDPKNSLWRFTLHCEIMKLFLGTLPARWHKGGAIKIAPYTAITLTGDRPKLFQLCRKYLLRQTLLPAQWIVVDDGKVPLQWENYCGSTYIRRQPTRRDPRHTLCRNMLEALPHIKYDRVIIFEDDDWYHPNYAETLLQYTTDLVGLGDAYYYYYAQRKYACCNNKTHAALANTCFNKSLLPSVKKLCTNDDSPLLDLRLWKLSCTKKIISPKRALYVGLKGLPGRPGQTSGHNAAASYYLSDNNRWLESVIGNDIKSYRAFDPATKPVTVHVPAGIRYSHDGSIFIPRHNKLLEAYLDKHFTRVADSLKWYPRITNAKSFETLRPVFENKICHIVGKGASLDALTSGYFNDGPIIAINEAIHKVESLNLANPIFMMQQDVRLQSTCLPKYGSILVPVNIAHIYGSHDKLYPFSLVALGLTSTPPTVIVAIEIAKLFRAKQIKFLCFDAYTQQQTNYANCVGYTAEKYGAPARFLHQDKLINRHIKDLDTQFITPGALVSQGLDTP